MRILGIDPGTSRIGYGVVTLTNGGLRLESSGVIEINKPSEIEKLLPLHNAIGELIERERPDASGVETIYFSKNQKTAIAVAQARGIILANLLSRSIPVYELTPQIVKLAVTDSGTADKIAVATMVRRLLDFTGPHLLDDVTDAIAIAIATSYHHQSAKRVGNTLR